MLNIINIILSGGIGSRLWPLSRKSKPKQFLPIFNGESLFEMTINRNQMLTNHFVAVGNKNHIDLSRKIFDKIKKMKFTQISEAAPRNTAAAIAFPCFDLHPKTIVLVTPSDHIINDNNAYFNDIKKGISLAKDGNIVCFGVKPTHAKTNYSYVEFEGFDVKSFKVKADENTAIEYIANGKYLWNAGIFCFQAGLYLKELEKFEPEIYASAQLAWKNSKDGFLPLAESLDIPSKSIDYAVIEKTDKIKVVPTKFIWSDLGSFDSIWDFQESQTSIDKIPVKNLLLSTNNKHIEILGVQDLIVVDTDDVILVLPRYQSQEVKKIYDKLEKENSTLLE